MTTPRSFLLPFVVTGAFAVLLVLLLRPRTTDEPAPRVPAKDFSKATAHKVLRVIDGDTVILNLDGDETRVRLIGVDTPETKHPEKPVERYGQEAARFLTNLLQGKSVYVEYDQDKTDKYGRALAYLFRAPDGLFVNLEIIRQGYGHAYTRFPFKDEYMTLFRHSEGEARRAGRGLWAEDPPPGKDITPGE
jgi:micrococcal nuclease